MNGLPGEDEETGITRVLPVGTSELLAKQLCAAYWTGWLEAMRDFDADLLNKKVDSTWKRWLPAARIALSMMAC